MRRSLLIIAVSAACGGAPKPTQLAPLPDDPKPATAPAADKPAQPAPVEAKPAAPVAPAAPLAPLEIKIAPLQTTVKIVSGGKGKKEAMHYTAKPGAKQVIELAIDFSVKQGTEEQVAPTIVLIGEAETKTVDKDGNAEYTVTVTGTDARAVAGSQVPVEQFKTALGTLAGLTIGGTLAATGVAGEVTMRMATPQAHTAEALDLIRVALPTLPVLPKEAVGVGAKWQSTTVAKLADRLDVTRTTDYELIAHKGTTWTIKGTTKVTGKDQELEGSKISEITGSGTSETTIAGGVLYPNHTSRVETQFKASEKDKSALFAIKVGGTVTPKAP
jgi:hypothetical protein